MQKKIFSGKYTWARSDKNLPELQFSCVSGVITFEFHLNNQLRERGSGKVNWIFFRVLSSFCLLICKNRSSIKISALTKQVTFCLTIVNLAEIR